jgi:hypothetical protein
VICAVSGAYSSTDLLFLLMTWLRILNCSIWWDFCHLLTYVPLLSLLHCIHYVNDSTAKETWRFTLVDSIDSIIVLPVQVIQELKRDLVWGVIDLQYWILGEGRINIWLVEATINLAAVHVEGVWFKHRHLLVGLNQPTTCSSWKLDSGGIKIKTILSATLG